MFLSFMVRTSPLTVVMVVMLHAYVIGVVNCFIEQGDYDIEVCDCCFA